jgi:hypothetical protein
MSAVTTSTLPRARPRQLGTDEVTLRARVGDGDDSAARVALGDPIGQRAPAAAEVEDPHPVLKARAPAGEVEHRLLGAVEVVHPGGPEGAAVFATGAEDQGEEGRRQLVVLGVGGLDV